MKNNMKKLLSLLLAVLMMASLSVTAFAASGDFTGDTMGKSDIKAYYKVVHESDYTDISGVKLTWSVPVVKYVDTAVTTWSTTELKWTKEQKISTEGNEVTFTLANYGSYAVKANVSFKPDVADSASVTYGKEIDDPDSTTEPKEKKTINENDPTIATIVNDDHSLKVTKTESQSDDDYATAKTKYIADNCTATISGTVSLNAANLSATSGRLGVYTVSIRNTVHTVTVSYLKNAADEEQTVETITVDDNTEISFTKNVLTIGTNEYTTAAVNADETAFSGWYSAPLQPLDVNTVTADMNITAAYWAS